MNFDAFLSMQTARIKAVPVVTEAVAEQPFRWTDRASESAERRQIRHERYKAKAARWQAKQKAVRQALVIEAQRALEISHD